MTVLAVSPFDEDRVFLNQVFSHSNWKMYWTRSFAEARCFLEDKVIPVVLCDSETPDGTWKDLLGQPATQTPLLIVTSRLADNYLWAEVLNMGGYDVLMKPFDHSEVVRVLSLAWLHWKNTQAAAKASSGA